jgi:hypothetical protein
MTGDMLSTVNTGQVSMAQILLKLYTIFCPHNTARIQSHAKHKGVRTCMMPTTHAPGAAGSSSEVGSGVPAAAAVVTAMSCCGLRCSAVNWLDIFEEAGAAHASEEPLPQSLCWAIKHNIYRAIDHGNGLDAITAPS